MKRLHLIRQVTAVSISLLLLTGSNLAVAGQADVLKAVASEQASRVFRFDVTIKSSDVGWDYYCDRFEIVGPKGEVLGTRVLFHPHDTEQPFTRSLSDVKIPAGIAKILVRATMKPTGEGGKTVTVALPAGK